MIVDAVIGKFKDESFGQAPSEFVGLRAKMYSFLDGKRTAKGIKKSVVYDRLTHEMYKNTSSWASTFCTHNYI